MIRVLDAHFSRSLSRKFLSPIPMSKEFASSRLSMPKPPVYVQDILHKLGPNCAVCFDVDSTVIIHEGIDLLAQESGCMPKVQALTSRAMDGSMLFEDSLQERLDIIKPNVAMLQKITQQPPAFSPGLEVLVKTLHERGVDVYLVSGGFRQMIEPIAVKLGIHPKEHVIANTILFDQNGDYDGFDRNELTSRSGGKAKALEQLRRTHSYSHIVMVGDGATDLEAREFADLMIGYGGVVTRSKVQNGADWFVSDFAPVTEELKV